MQKILSAMRRAIIDYDMIQDGDRVFVGLSGGKDSTLLLTALAAYRRFSPQKFTLEAITIDMGLKDTKQEELDALIAHCKNLDVPHHLVKTDIAEIIFDLGFDWRKERDSLRDIIPLRLLSLYSSYTSLILIISLSLSRARKFICIVKMKTGYSRFPQAGVLRLDFRCRSNANDGNKLPRTHPLSFRQ